MKCRNEIQADQSHEHTGYSASRALKSRDELKGARDSNIRERHEYIISNSQNQKNGVTADGQSPSATEPQRDRPLRCSRKVFTYLVGTGVPDGPSVRIFRKTEVFAFFTGSSEDPLRSQFASRNALPYSVAVRCLNYFRLL